VSVMSMTLCRLDSEAKHEALLTKCACATLNWGWHYGEPFNLGVGRSLLSMLRLLGILFIGIEIAIEIGID